MTRRLMCSLLRIAGGAAASLLVACSIDAPLALHDAPRNEAAAVPSVAFSSAYGVCNYDMNENQLTSAGWSKVFEDDFVGNLSQWSIWTGGAFNNELQYYQPANLVLDAENDLLDIITRRETVTGVTSPYDATPKTFSFTSGRIESKALFSASRNTPRVRLSARLKLPAGIGMWPAFWSYGDPWPTEGEIDVMEARGSDPYQYQTNYFFGRRAGVNLVQGATGYVSSSSSLTDCYHVYEVVWEKSALTFLLDNVVVDTKSGGYVPSMYGHKERIVLNVAVGGNFFSNLDPATIQPGTMLVDWVRAFTSR